MNKKIIINIKGMTCASCSASNEKALNKTQGVLSANVNFASKKAYVEYNSEITDELKIKEAIIKNGYKIESDIDIEHNHNKHAMTHNIKMKNGEHKHGGEDIKKSWRAFLMSAILSLPLVLEMFYKYRIGINIYNMDLIMWLHILLATIIVFYFGWRFHKMAFKQAKKFQANMDSLISMGTLAAYFYSLWALVINKEGYLEAASLIIVLIILGKYFEAKSTGQAGEAMKKLMELGVKKAKIVFNGEEKEVDISEIKVGDILIVKPSEKIPLDGIIIEGESSIDESMLTGESLPIDKTINSKVFGATINQDGIIKIKVTEIGEATVLSQIIKTVEEALGTKAPIQKLADIISGIFVPIVIIISIITFTVWIILTNNISVSLINAIAVLIIACPCALGLATPIAIMIGTGKGAKNGILFKSGESFEKAKNINMIIFDKTGTLTKGELRIKKIINNPQYNFSEEKIIKIAASLGKNSEHPLSRAVYKYAKEKNIILKNFKNAKEIKGKGVLAFCSEHNEIIGLGNIKLLEELKIETNWAKDILTDDHLEVGTQLFVAHGDKNIGVIIVADVLREEAKKVVSNLKNMGLETAIITGDNKKIAKNVAYELNIQNVFAEVLPDEKSFAIKKLQEAGKKIIFVGDGINDAPSLVQADLGIAMGNATDIAKEAGQITLMANNLEKVVEAIKISKLTFKTIKQNLFWAFIYNIVAIPLAAFGFLNPIIAAGAMSFSDVSIVINSLRIYKK